MRVKSQKKTLPVKQVLGAAHFREAQKSTLLFPRVVMASEGKGESSSHLMTITNTKRHPNNTKTDQLPVLRSLPAFQGRTITCSYYCIICTTRAHHGESRTAAHACSSSWTPDNIALNRRFLDTYQSH